MSSPPDLLEAATPPAGPAPLYRAVAHATRRLGQGACLVQDAAGVDAAWVHAHLHRAEGDAGNAGSWYRRAGRPAATGDLALERATIATALGRQERPGEP